MNVEVESKETNNNIILAQTPEIEQGLGLFLGCGARKPEQNNHPFS